MGMSTKTKPSPSWRDTLPIHPAAELFPRMSPDELRALGEDIQRNGQRQPIAVIEKARPRADGTLHIGDPPLQIILDGINRLDALEMLGISVLADNGQLADHIQRIVIDPDETDPSAFVVSANVHRRHLTGEQKREIVATLLKANPERSNNATAKIAKVDDKTVGAVRAELERRSEIPNVETRTDTRGRQHAMKPRNHIRARLHQEMKLGEDTVAKVRCTTLDNARELDALAFLNRGAPEGSHTPEVEHLVAAASSGEAISAVACKESGGVFRRDDIGPASSGETARKDAEIEKLRAQKRRLKIENIGLRSEIEEAEIVGRTLRSVSSEKLLAELERRLPAKLRKEHQAAIKAITAALDSRGQHVGPTLDLEVIPDVSDSEATKH
jgi:hypothetical protein